MDEILVQVDHGQTGNNFAQSSERYAPREHLQIISLLEFRLVVTHQRCRLPSAKRDKTPSYDPQELELSQDGSATGIRSPEDHVRSLRYEFPASKSGLEYLVHGSQQ